VGLAQRGLDALWLRPSAGGALTMPIVMLRQLRDLADPELAAYQSIVEAGAHVTGYRGATWSAGDAHEIRVHEHASMPLVSELGLESATPRALASSHARFDFVVDAGREVWRAE
jgi:hypothetical protein